MNSRQITVLSRRRVLAAFGAAVGYAALRPAAALASERPQGNFRALAFDAGALVVAADGIWISRDGGASFAVSELSPPDVTALATHPDRPGLICAAREAGGLAVSADGGASWRSVGAGLPTAAVDAVAIAAQDPMLIYVAVRGDGIWLSKDGGESWEFAMDRPFEEQAERDILALASVSSPSGMGGIWVFAGTELGVTKVPDCFCRWQEIGFDSAMDALVTGQAVQADPASMRLPREPVVSLALAPSAPNVLYAGLPSGIWRSEDTGETWRLLTDALASPCLAVNPVEPNHIVAASMVGAILSSRDGGLTWAAPASN